MHTNILRAASRSLVEQLVVLYDSCRSGSFIPLLIPPAGKQRVLATSAASGEETLFSVGGTLSFSYLFWSHMFNGDSFYDCFLSAKDSVAMAYPNRMTPQIEVNGNGVGNEKEDKTLAKEVGIGLGIQAGSDLPSIGNVSPTQTVSVGSSALIYAKDVIALRGSTGYGRLSPRLAIPVHPMILSQIYQPSIFRR